MTSQRLEIYLLPVGPQDYELYCEPSDHAAGLDGAPQRGALGWLSRTFHSFLVYIENERHRRHERERAQHGRTWYQRVRDRVMGWIAERVAEQRLLWRLRAVTAAVVYQPDDIDEGTALRVVRRSLKRDRVRHLVWMVIDLAVYLAGLPLSVLPGPNPVTWYASFRAIGHLLSALGAHRGLRRIAWHYEPCAPLVDLRRCAHLDPVARDTLAHDVAVRLELEHLAAFVERLTSIRP